MKRITLQDIPLPGLSDVGFEFRQRQLEETYTPTAREHPGREGDSESRHTRNGEKQRTRLPGPVALVFRRLGWL